MLDSLNRGGAEMLCLDVARNAGRHGFDLTFVASGGGDLESDFASSGTDFIRLQRRFPIDPLLVQRLRKIITERGIEVVHAQQAVEAIHLYLATRGTNVKCLMSLQNYILDRKNRIATEWIVPRMDAVCPVSDSMQEWFRNGEGFDITDRFFVLPNGVDRSRLVPTRPSSQQSLRNELGISTNSHLLGMVGNFYPDVRKDQLTICKALPQVLADRNDVHFVFVGSVHAGAEEYFEKCHKICNDARLDQRVHFVGKRADIPDILAELDLFVFSSVQEGLPVAAVEALLMGVPMLVSDIPPLLEVTGNIDGEQPYSAVFTTGDPEDLALNLDRLLSEPDELRGLGESAKALAPKRYSIEAHLDRLMTVYETIRIPATRKIEK